MPASRTSTREMAAWYASLGIRVLPLHGIVGGKCTCGTDCGRDAGKHPIAARAATPAS
jgi:hypothetical protein